MHYTINQLFERRSKKKAIRRIPVQDLLFEYSTLKGTFTWYNLECYFPPQSAHFDRKLTVIRFVINTNTLFELAFNNHSSQAARHFISIDYRITLHDRVSLA